MIYNPENLSNFQNAIEALEGRDNTIYNISILGDSITEGYYASDMVNKSYVGQLRKHFANRYGDVGDGFMPSWYPTTATTPAQTWWGFTGTWTTPAVAGLHSYSKKTVNQNDTATVTFRGTEFHIIVVTGGSWGTFTVSIDGGDATTFDANITYSLSHEFTITGLSEGQHTAVITNTHATKWLQIIGIYGQRGNRGINVHCMGRAGARVEGHSYPASLDTSIDHFEPVLTIIPLIVNDFEVQVSLTLYRQYLQTIITEGLKYGDVLLATIGPDLNSHTIPQSSYIDVMYDLADSNNIALYDLYAYWEDGILESHPNYLNDSAHPSDSGHSNIGLNMYKHLMLTALDRTVVNRVITTRSDVNRTSIAR